MNQPPPLKLGTIRIVHLALGVGVTVFAVISLYIYFGARQGPAQKGDIHGLLSWVALGGTCLSAIVGKVVGDVIMKKQRENVTGDLYEVRYQVYFSGHLIRIAAIEGMAMLACVSLLIGRPTESGPFAMPHEWAAVGAIGFFLIIWGASFPSERSICKALDLSFDDYPTQ